MQIDMIRPGRSFFHFLTLTIITLLSAIVIGHELLYRAAFLWVILFIGSYFWTVLSLRGLVIIRSTRESRVEFGQPVLEFITLENRSLFPKIQIELIDKSTIIHDQKTRLISGIPAKSARSISKFIPTTKRGYFDLGPTIIRSGDLFGLFTKEMITAPTNHYMVTPPVVDIGNKGKFDITRIAGSKKRNKKTADSISPVSIRPYIPGDPLKNIHWPSTARHQQYMVKQFNQERQTTTFLILNCFRNSQYLADENLMKERYIFGRKEKRIQIDTIEYIACIAASITNNLLQSGNDLGMFINNSKKENIPPDNEIRQLTKILESLAFLEADGYEPLLKLIHSTVPSIQAGCDVVIISPAREENLVESAATLLAKGVHPELILIYPEKDKENLLKLENELSSNGISFLFVPMDGSLLSLQQTLNQRS